MSPPTLTLEQHAGLTAALAEGHPPADVLALEGLDDPSWRAADAAWKEKLAAEGPEAPIFVTYRDKLAVAEDWLSRPVDPLDGDIAAWMGFLGAYGAHAAPFELLQKLGLGLNDLSRLGRRWAKKLAEDEQVRKQAAEIAKKKPKEAPSVRAKEGKLRPFPWSKGASKVADEEAQRAREDLPPIDDDFGLDRYASISAELALDPKGAEHALAKYGISRKDLEGIEERWKARIEADPALERDWRRLYASYHARFSAASKRAEIIDREAAAPEEREPIAAPPPKPIFASTSLSLAIPRSALLPFMAGFAPPEIAEPTPAEEKEARPRNNLGGTALVLDVPRGPALPFEGLGAPAPPPDPKLFAGTALALDIPRGAALPFAEGEAPESISQPSIAEEEGKRARRDFGGTSLALDLPITPVLPFEDDTEAQAARRKANPFAQLSLDMDIQALLRKAASAPPAEATPKPSSLQSTSILPESLLPVSPPQAPLPAPPAPSPLQSTSILAESLLPVSPTPAALPAPPRPSPLQSTSILPDALVSAPPLPVPEPPPPPVQSPPWVPELSLEQHASLCVEIAMTPDHASEVIARYRLTTAQKARIDEHYRARVAESAEVRAAWDRAYHAYYEWMAKPR